MCLFFTSPVPEAEIKYHKMGGMFVKEEEPSLAVQEFVDREIRENKVMVFSKSTCPYCKMAKKALTDVGATFKAVELDKQDNQSAVQQYLATLTGGSTVPRVFINGKFIGGGSETKALKENGQLEILVQAD